MVLQLSSVEGITIYGPKPGRRGSPLCTFNVDGIHPTDLSTFLDFEGLLALMTVILASAAVHPSACVSCLLQDADLCHSSLLKSCIMHMHKIGLVRGLFYEPYAKRHVVASAGIAVRSGHHCTQPLHHALGISSSARASPYIYNTEAEVDNFVEALNSVIGVLK